ncbi:MAG: prolyl-tRNA synthetase associated domain-containing protein [Oscillospiraceae bacterium]|nr:prolyl-tRNA synthetase associated domain-containing protein [Oscillospiraceae bacterium]
MLIKEMKAGRPDLNAERSMNEVKVYDFLDKAGIKYMRADHEAVFNMERCLEIEEAMSCKICKNLFLCNRQKTKFYFLIMPGYKKLDVKALSEQTGLSRLSFANAEDLKKYLDIEPGSASVLCLINDIGNYVQLLADREVLTQDFMCCHPCVNTSTIKIKTEDIIEKLLKKTGHDITVVNL